MRKPPHSQPTAYSALMMEEDQAGRSVVMLKVEQFWRASHGHALQIALEGSVEAVEAYRASNHAFRADPRSKRQMAHREGLRAITAIARLRKDYDTLRDRCVEDARDAVYRETGRRCGEPIRAIDRPVQPTEPSYQEYEARKLPDPNDEWRECIRRLQPQRQSPRPVQQPIDDGVMTPDDLRKHLDDNMDKMVEGVLAGVFNAGHMEEMRRELEAACPTEPGIWADVQFELDKRVQKARAAQSGQG